jgi:hypothetical protein
LIASHLHCSRVIEKGEHEEDNEVKNKHRLAPKTAVNTCNYRVFKYIFKRRFTSSNIR